VEGSVALRAVLFDVGGPLNAEVAHERAMDARMRAALAADGFAVDDASYARACRWAVDSFASDTYAAIVWRLAGQDPVAARRVYGRMRSSGGEYAFELREGIPALLGRCPGCTGSPSPTSGCSCGAARTSACPRRSAPSSGIGSTTT
jgi:hypothetical protein